MKTVHVQLDKDHPYNLLHLPSLIGDPFVLEVTGVSGTGLVTGTIIEVVKADNQYLILTVEYKG